MQRPLLASVFIVASCGLAYELIAGALASYLLGDSVTQFSTVIGAYLFAMGIGSWLSKHVSGNLLVRFIQIELMVGLLGGISAGLLFLLFTLHAGPFRFTLYGLVLLIGILVGLEIPLIMRILKRDVEFKELVAQVLSFDYIGALAVSLLFPLLLAPHLGLVRSALLFGLLNALVAAWALWLFRDRIGRLAALRAQCAVVIGLLVLGFGFAGQFVGLAEANLYNEDIVHAESSPYQRIVVTKYRDETRLYLNHNLQFSSRDEYRYHEALVHPGLAALPGARKILVLGGGDGMAVREILKYPQVDSITLVDLDARMTELFAQSPLLRQLNGNALASPKLKVINADALQWLEASTEMFDFVVADFPDPSNHGLGKLYSTAFYRLLKQHVAETGSIVVQATSPMYARQSFWTVVATLEAAGWRTAPYHALVPSFGEWGYILAGKRDYRPPQTIPVPTRFVTPDAIPALFHFPADMARLTAEPNRLDNQNLVRIFEREWGRVQAHSMRRRDFLAASSAAAALAACGGKSMPPLPPGTLTGANDTLGHRLRQPDFPAPTETRKLAVAIVGGGIAGLSAAWKLARAGCDDYLLLEMEAEPGGNSRAGKNEVSAYPLGAHYLPLPPREARATRALLAELGVLRGNPDAAHPDYDERYLCQAPQERLYKDGYWQEGLWPTLGVPAAERTQYTRFQEFIQQLRQQRDGSGRRPFALPLDLSSRDAQRLALDRSNLRDWLLAQGYTAPGLHWLADYACRDDYGTAATQTSAWAGLHYFACRDGEGQVLTAPEGNAWLARGLARTAAGRVLPQALTFRVELGKQGATVDVYLAAEQRSIRLLVRELIWAAPLFLLPRVFANPPRQWLEALRGVEYAPWVVATLTLSAAPQTRAGQPLAWDNVIHDSAALGYVVATHQQLRYAPGPTVISWYRALHEESATESASRTLSARESASRAGKRRLLYSREDWAQEILADLSRPHPEIRELVTQLDVHRHAHAMIRPLPGRLWGGARAVFERGLPGLQFAHADVSGLSLFEEANYRGVLAAERTLRRLGVSFASSL